MFAIFTQLDGVQIRINPRLVEAVSPAPAALEKAGAQIFCGARAYVTTESPEDVEKALGAALLDVYRAKGQAARPAGGGRSHRPGQPSGAGEGGAEGGEGGGETH